MRRNQPELFSGYRPVPAAAHAVAFARSSSLVRWPPGCPSSSRPAARGGWCDNVLPLPGAATDRHDIVTGTPVDGSAPAPGTALLVRPA